jgi:hypothetical protein
MKFGLNLHHAGKDGLTPSREARKEEQQHVWLSISLHAAVHCCTAMPDSPATAGWLRPATRDHTSPCHAAVSEWVARTPCDTAASPDAGPPGGPVPPLRGGHGSSRGLPLHPIAPARQNYELRAWHLSSFSTFMFFMLFMVNNLTTTKP